MPEKRKVRSTQELLDSAQRKLAAARGEVDSRKKRVAKLRARDRREERKRSDRRKILWGALIQKVMADPKTNQDFRDWWNQKLDKFLTRPEERALFGLLPRPGPQSPPAQVQSPPSSVAPRPAAQPATASQAAPGAQGGTVATAPQPPAQQQVPAAAQPQSAPSSAHESALRPDPSGSAE